MISCSVHGCKNRVDFRFPSDPERKKKWLEAIRRPTYIPKKHHGLCHHHFVKQHLVVESRDGGFKNTRRILSRDAVPCVFTWNFPEPEFERMDCEMRPIKQEREDVALLGDPEFEPMVDAALGDPEFEPMMDIKTDDCGAGTADDLTTGKIEASCQCDLSESVQSTRKSTTSTQTPRTLGIFTIEELRLRRDFISYYTGLESYDKFMKVLRSLGRDAYTMKYRNSQVISVSVPDQLFITLWKLKRNCADFELGINFGVSKATVSNIVHTWIKFMARQWSKIDIWPSKEMVEYYMPATLRTKYPPTNDKVIVDGTEIPKNPQARRTTFRAYSKRKTSKIGTGVAPGCMTSYCSPADTASTSDQQMDKHSSFLANNECDPYDPATEDKRSNVQDNSTSEDFKVNITTFVKSRDSLPATTLLNDDKLAVGGIHMERIIRLAKTYKMWNTKLNYHLVPLATEIFSLVIILCRFREGFIAERD